MRSRAHYKLVLTHDIDVLSVRELPWPGKTLWGFAYRCLRRALSPSTTSPTGVSDRVRMAILGLAMPLIKAGLWPDPWATTLQTVLDIETQYGVRSTLYFIPFPEQSGCRPDGSPAPANRGAHYRLSQQEGMLQHLLAGGWEVGVHGLDAHRSPAAARRELAALASLTGQSRPGIRMHWLYHYGRPTWEILSEAGYLYDASFGWNDQIGFRGGHHLPFNPLSGADFSVLPLNVQDVALLDYASLSLADAWTQVSHLLDEADRSGAVVTVLWHNNSFAPPRDWGSLYCRLLERAVQDGAAVLRAVDAVQMWQAGRL